MGVDKNSQIWEDAKPCGEGWLQSILNVTTELRVAAVLMNSVLGRGEEGSYKPFFLVYSPSGHGSSLFLTPTKIQHLCM